MGEHNRLRVKDYYIDNYAAKYEALFQKTIEMKKGAVDVNVLKSRTATFD
jgi:hypothetical protein